MRFVCNVYVLCIYLESREIAAQTRFSQLRKQPEFLSDFLKVAK